MRLFIAAELPASLFEALAETSALLRDAMRGRYVAPDSLHVTLAFIGEVPGARVPELADLLDAACADILPIPARLGPLGSFGRRSRATLWQSVESDDALEALAGELRRRLRDAGFSFDDKGFLAHATLMRSADLASGALPMPLAANGEIDAVTLFKSDLSGPHPVYTALHTAHLGVVPFDGTRADC